MTGRAREGNEQARELRALTWEAPEVRKTEKSEAQRARIKGESAATGHPLAFEPLVKRAFLAHVIRTRAII